MERQYKILMVDDEQEFLEVYSQQFTRRGFIVDTAADGLAGLEKLRQDEFDVAIIDILMPKMNGIELVGRIQAEEIDTSVIIMTGHGERDEAVSAINYGVEAWFDKQSIDASTLVQRVRELAQVIPPEEMRRILSGVMA